MYPAKTVRRINAVKQLMIDGYTIEEIQGQFLLYTDLVEGVAENLAELCARLARDTESSMRRPAASCTRTWPRHAQTATRLVERLDELARRIAAPRTDTLRLAGAAGGAEDLL